MQTKMAAYVSSTIIHGTHKSMKTIVLLGAHKPRLLISSLFLYTRNYYMVQDYVGLSQSPCDILFS